MVELLILVVVLLGCLVHWLRSERKRCQKRIGGLEAELADTRLSLKEKNIECIEDKLYILRLKEQLKDMYLTD